MTVDNSTIEFNIGNMAAILLCDPHYTIQRAEVVLQNGQLKTTLVDLPLIGNFPEPAANSLFSQALLNAFSPGGKTDSPAISALKLGDDRASLSLPNISQNMNDFIQSAAKAYISGYTGLDGSQLGLFPSYSSFNQTVISQQHQVSLISSRVFLVALWVLDVIIICILVVLLCTTSVEEMWPFSIQTMETIYRGMCRPALTSLHDS